mgnify:CR=1 FL=1
MKKYIQKGRAERAYYICDIYPKEKPVFRKGKDNVCASLDLVFNYGSGWDGFRLKLDLSGRAAEEIFQMLETKYGEKTIKNLVKYMS